MKPRVILAALLLAPPLLGQDTTPPPAHVQDRGRVASGPTDDEEGCIDSVDTTPALAEDVRQLEEILTNLGKLTESELLEYAASLRLPDGVIQPGFPEYLELKRQLQELLDQGLARKHPDVVAKSKEIDVIRKQLDEGAVALRDALQAKLEIAEARLKRAQAAQELIKGGRPQMTEEEFAGLKTSISELEEILRSLTKPDGQLLWAYAMTLQIPDNPLTTLYPKHRQLQLELAKLAKDGGGDDDNRVIAKREQLGKNEQEMSGEIVRHREIFQSKLNLAKIRLARATAALGNARTPAGDESPPQTGLDSRPAEKPVPAAPE